MDPEVIEEESEDKIAQEARLVVALDYGTTFTGVGYATCYGAECPPLDRIAVNGVWGESMNNQAKIASVISYSEPSQNREQQWGDSLAPNSIAMVHTKLELDVKGVFEELDLTIQALEGMQNLRFQYIQGSQGLPPYTYKSPEGIVTDYLTKVYGPASRGIDRFARRVRDDTATDIVVTIPTGWRYPAINSTFRALTLAGFNRENFPSLRDVLFISEPEAASRYTVRFLKEKHGDTFLKTNAYFVLCDAGGGTVDVVSYKVKQVSPVLQLQQIGYPTGRKCGSIFINMEFKKWLLKELLGEKNYAKIDPQMAADKITSHSTEGDAMRKLMAKFNEHKIAFEGNTGQVYYMELPYPLDNLTIPGKVQEGEFTFTGADMERFFKVCVGQVVELIRGHMLQIENAGGRPKNVFMVGGFGQSVYLHRRVEYSLSLWNVRLRKPDDSWTAVAQGAVICGIEKLTTSSLRKASACRHSYGIKLNTLFSDVYNNERDIYIDSRGVPLAKAQLVWMLNKGDVCLHNEEREVEEDVLLEFSATSDKRRQLPIYRYSDDDRPDRYQNAQEELTEVANIAIDLNHIPLDQFVTVRGQGKHSPSTYKALVKLHLILRNERLSASVWWNGTELPGTAIENIPY